MGWGSSGLAGCGILMPAETPDTVRLRLVAKAPRLHHLLVLDENALPTSHGAVHRQPVPHPGEAGLPHVYGDLVAIDKFSDNRMAGNLTGDKQAAGGLGVR